MEKWDIIKIIYLYVVKSDLQIGDLNEIIPTKRNNSRRNIIRS